jgi:hypothetical protein
LKFRIRKGKAENSTTGRKIEWEGSKNPAEMTGKLQNPVGKYPKDSIFLLVIQDVRPLPAVQNIHPTDRLHLADSPQISLVVFRSWCRRITFETISRGIPFRLAWVAEYRRRSWGVRETFNRFPILLIAALAVE